MPASAGGRERTDAVSAEFSGLDASRTVRLWLADSGRGARVGLDRRWRAAVGPERLGGAAVEALGAAVVAQVGAWSGGSIPSAPAWGTDRLGSGASLETSAHLRRACQDLREFRAQLAALAGATWTVPGAGRLVVAVLRAGQVVGLELDPRWRRVASDGELEHHIGHTLSMGLRQCATLPQRALDGCPDLAAVLARAGAPATRCAGGWAESP
jgi:hypothetical protein